MASCRELRERARYSLGGKVFGKTWIFAILATIIVMAVTAIAGSFTLGLGSIIVTGPLIVGLYGFYLNTARSSDEMNDFTVLFKSFKHGQRYILPILTAIYTFLWSILFVIPGIVKFFAYSMAPYIIADKPGLSAKYALSLSQDMMKGHKWKLFCLYLSFIGWFILCGIPVIGWCLIPWVGAYVQASMAEFYEEIR